MLVEQHDGLEAGLSNASELKIRVKTLEEAFASGNRSVSSLRQLLAAKEQLEAMESSLAEELNRAGEAAEQLAAFLRGKVQWRWRAGQTIEAVADEVLRLAGAVEAASTVNSDDEVADYDGAECDD